MRRNALSEVLCNQGSQIILVFQWMFSLFLALSVVPRPCFCPLEQAEVMDPFHEGSSKAAEPNQAEYYSTSNYC